MSCKLSFIALCPFSMQCKCNDCTSAHNHAMATAPCNYTGNIIVLSMNDDKLLKQTCGSTAYTCIFDCFASNLFDPMACNWLA